MNQFQTRSVSSCTRAGSSATGRRWPRDFWNDIDRVRDLVVVVTHSDASELTVTFSGVDGSGDVADAIGACFDLVLRPRRSRPDLRTRQRWLLEAQGLDWRVQVDSPINVATEDQPFSIFGA